MHELAPVSTTGIRVGQTPAMFPLASQCVGAYSPARVSPEIEHYPPFPQLVSCALLQNTSRREIPCGSRRGACLVIGASIRSWGVGLSDGGWSPWRDIAGGRRGNR